MIRDSGSQVRKPFGKRTDTGRHDMEQQTQPGHQHQEGPLTNSRGMTTRWGVESSISRPPYTDSIAAPIPSSTQLTGDRTAFIRGPDGWGGVVSKGQASAQQSACWGALQRCLWIVICSSVVSINTLPTQCL